MGKKDTGWRGWWKSLWEESVATSVATSTTVSETVSVAPSAPVSEAVSVDPTPISSGDSVTIFRGDGVHVPSESGVTAPTYMQFGEKLRYGSPTGTEVFPDSPTTARQSRIFTNASVEANSLPWWWKNAAGTARADGPEWWDSTDTVRGTSAFATATISANTPGQAVTWSGAGMVALIQKILDEGTAGIAIIQQSGANGTLFCTKDNATEALRPDFHIVTDQGTFDVGALRDSTLQAVSNPTYGFAETMDAPYLIMPDLTTIPAGATVQSGTTMTLYTATSTQTIPCDYHAYALKTDPLITAPQTQLGGVEYGIAATVENELALAGHSSVRFYPSFASQAACEAAGWTGLNFAAGDPDLDSFQHIKEYGINLMRIKSRYPGHAFSDGQTLISWEWTFPDTTTTEAYARILFRLSEEARDYINESGVKMPGFNGPLDGTQTTRISYRAEHMPPSDANPHVYALARHAYDSENPQGGGNVAENRPWGNACILAGTAFANIYSIEFRLKINTESGGVWQSDGIDQVWVNGVKVYNDTTRRIHNTGFGGGAYIASLFLNYYHGGQNTPTGMFTADIGGVCVASEYIGPPPVQSLERDLNSGSWVSTWNDTQTRVNMEYSNAHQHTDGRQLEFCMAQHTRAAGDNTGVRWADFTSTAAPTGGYYWSNTDTNIRESDNQPSAYLPWKGWVIGFNGLSALDPVNGQKIISIDGTPSAIFRNNDGDGDSIETDHIDIEYPTGAGLTAMDTASTRWWDASFNPSCLVNPNSTHTVFWGGGYNGSNFPGGHGSVFRLIDDNPSYPADARPLRMRIFRPTGAMSPTHSRYMLRIGDWYYWGGGGINPDTGTADLTRHNEFYRIYIPDLLNLTFTQERITDGPTISVPGYLAGIENAIRFPLLFADTTTKKLGLVTIQGVYRYTVPADDGNDGTWEGPITFGLADWAGTISEGDNEALANWHGCVGTHRSDLNQTFFRYNRSKSWNRIRWTN